MLLSRSTSFGERSTPRVWITPDAEFRIFRIAKTTVLVWYLSCLDIFPDLLFSLNPPHGICCDFFFGCVMVRFLNHVSLVWFGSAKNPPSG
jgi:hypothetical protein